MAPKSGSRKKSGDTCSGDARERDRLIDELKERVAVLENESRLKQGDTTSRETIDSEPTGEYQVLFQRMVDKAADMVFLLGPMGRILYANEAACKALGYTLDELRYMTVFDFNQIHYVDNWLEHEEELKKQGSMTFENVLKAKDGRLIPVEICANYARLGDKEYNYSFIRDITERKQMESKLRVANRALVEKSRYLDAFFNHTITPLVLLDRDFNFIRVNEAYARACHREVAEFPGHNHFEFYPSNAKAIFENVVRTRQPVQVIARPFVFRDDPDRGVTYWNWTLTPLLDDSGDVEALVFALEEVTELKRTEEAVRENEARRRVAEAVEAERRRLFDVLETLPAMVCLLTPDHHVAFANRSFCEKFGESHGRHCYEYCFGRSEPCEFCESYKVLETSQPHHWEMTGPDGSTIDVYDFPFTDVDGTPMILEMDIDITERKRSEEALRESEEKLRSFFDLPLIGMALTSPERGWIYANDRICEILGFSREELLQLTWDKISHPEDLGSDLEHFNRLLSGEIESYTIEKRFVRKDGGIVHTQISIGCVRNPDNSVRYIVGLMQDITERKRAEEAVKLVNMYNRSLIEASLDPLVTISPAGVITDVNKATEKVTGIPREKLIGTDFSDYFTEPEKAKEGYLKVFKEGSVTDYPLEIRHRDGYVTPVIYNASVYKDEAGKVIGVFAAARDITEQKTIEEARLQLAAIVDSSDDAIIGKTLDGIITSWNVGAARLYGYREDEVLGRSISILASPDYPDEIPSILDKIRHGGHIEYYETVRRRKDGSNVNVSLSVSPIKDSNSRLIGASTITRDITEKKRAEEAIRRAGSYNRNLIEASLDPLVTIAPDGTVTDVNVATETVTGYPREQLIGTDFSDYFTEPEKAKRGYQTVFKEGSVTDYPLEIRHRDGHITPVIYNASVYRDETGRVIGVFAAARDVTERKRAESEVREAKAQAELYLDLMGHDINNMNQIALGYLELAVDAVKDNEIKELVKKPLDAIQNSSKLIENVRKLQKLKSGGLKTEAIDLDGLLAELRKQYMNVPGKQVTIDYMPCKNCRVMANGLLRDVFSNLIGNAIKHSGSSKSVRIGLGLERVRMDGSDYCKVVVEDNGPGIPDAQKSKVFARFRTENAKAGGRGMGLYLVYSLVEDFHGTVHVEDRVPGDYTKGARFVVLLPAVEK